MPVATTVHRVQILDEFPRDPTDLPLTVIVTPEKIIRVRRTSTPPSGIDWGQLSKEDLDAMPVLQELRSLAYSRDKARRTRSKR